MEGSTSKWSACCTSTLFPQLIGIIIGEIGWVVSEEKRTQTASCQASKFPKSKYFATLTCSHGGVKVKIKCMLHIYTVPSVDWYHHWRNRLSSFGGEANTIYYPSAKIICDRRTDEWTNGRTDTLITIWPPFRAIVILIPGRHQQVSTYLWLFSLLLFLSFLWRIWTSVLASHILGAV